MARDLLVRGFDDDVHFQLSKTANDLGVSLNSIVKDAVDKWIEQRRQIPKKHDLILYEDYKAIADLLRTMDRMTKNNGWFRSHCGPPSNPAVHALDSYDWFNGTILPYEQISKNVIKYCSQVMERIAKKAKGNLVCCMDFILGDIAHQDSLKNAIKIEKGYNTMRTKGLMFCPYQTKDLLSAGIENMIDLFEEHDQVYVLKKDRLYKLHVTQESIHKLFFA